MLAGLDPETFRGTLVAVPVVNVLGFMAGGPLPARPARPQPLLPRLRARLARRPDRAPLHDRGRRKCDVGLDLHTGSDRRSNLPQIRADLDDDLTRQLAEAFAAPVMLHAGIRDGSLRHAAREQGAKVLLYEAGECLRFDAYAIDAGVIGVRRVLARCG